MKDVLWVGSSKADWAAFPQSAQDAAGYQLDKVRRGLEPSDWKPMPTIAAGVCELRIAMQPAHSGRSTWRPGRKAFTYCTPFRNRPRKRASAICALRRTGSRPSPEETA